MPAARGAATVIADWLLALALALFAVGLLVIFLVGRERPKETPAVCAWCVWRSGDDCTAPGSPVSGGRCEPVRQDRLRCEVRQVLAGAPGDCLRLGLGE
jgi:hypothetical protein